MEYLWTVDDEAPVGSLQRMRFGKAIKKKCAGPIKSVVAPPEKATRFEVFMVLIIKVYRGV